MKKLLLVLCANLVLILSPLFGEPHEWTDTEGKTIKAEFVSASEEAVTISMQGKVFVVKLTDLTPQSRALAAKLRVQKSTVQKPGIVAEAPKVVVANKAPRAQAWEPAKTYVVIVGVLEWKNDLTPFSKRNRKDRELRDLLIKRGTPAENIIMLLDREATLPKIRKAIAHTLRKTSRDSTLIIYYDGHGWADGDDFCFANYEVQLNRKETAWSINELATIVASKFKGSHAFFWADCCYSGGLEMVVNKLTPKRVASFSLTSASTANTSTGNWTFTQSLLDGLSGEPIIDTNGDNLITLGELRAEVRDAMNHLEGQAYGFKANLLDDSLILAKTSSILARDPEAMYPLGTYVRAKGAYGRVVEIEAGEYSVQFYHYTEKVVERYAEKDLVASTRKPGPKIKPDCTVEWDGTWYAAKVLKKKPGYWYIRYVDYDDSWDEWVGPNRIRFKRSGTATKE